MLCTLMHILGLMHVEVSSWGFTTKDPPTIKPQAYMSVDKNNLVANDVVMLTKPLYV